MSEPFDPGQVPATDLGLFKKGAIVGDLYRLNEKVGEGAFGEVWSGTTIATGEQVALKRLHSSVASNIESFRRFRREAALLARVKSDYVAKLINFLPDLNHGLVLVLEFIEGAPLSELFEVQTISVEMAIDIGVDMLCALRDLHASRIIHRDIKPANVILRPLANGDSQAIICDFSTSRLVGRQPGARHTGASMGGSHSMSQSLTPTNATLGTLHYMSPEQILSSRDVSERTDIYAVGAVLWRGVSGAHVFEEHNGPVSMARHKLMQEAARLQTGRTDQVAREFEDVIARALRRRPQDRYASAVDMLEAFQRLHRLAAGESESATRLMTDRASLVGDEPELMAALEAAAVSNSEPPKGELVTERMGAKDLVAKPAAKPAETKPVDTVDASDASQASQASQASRASLASIPPNDSRESRASLESRESLLPPLPNSGTKITLGVFVVSLFAMFGLGILCAWFLFAEHGPPATPTAPATSNPSSVPAASPADPAR